MAGEVFIINILKPKNGADFPVVEDIDFKGGFRSCATEEARDAITLPHRQAGMLVYTLNSSKLWVLGGTYGNPANTGTNGDWAQVVLGGTAPAPYEFTIEGDLSLIAALPALFAPSKRVVENSTITGVLLTRDVAGVSDFTRVDILVNGVSIFALDADKPIVTPGGGAYAFSLKVPTAGAALVAGDRVEAEIEAVEGGNPENIRVTVLRA